MMHLLKFLNQILGFILIKKINIKIGTGTDIHWWRLGAKAGTLCIGAASVIKCRIDFDSADGKVTIGDRCYLGASHLVCHTSIQIGNDVIMSWGVTIVDHDSHSLDWAKRSSDVKDWKKGLKKWDYVAVSPVNIGDKVWIGFGASILKGVTVGEGAVIGARSTVTRNVPPFTVVAGNPAKVVRQLQKDQ